MLQKSVSHHAAALSYHILFAIIPFVFVVAFIGNFFAPSSLVLQQFLSFSEEKFGLEARAFLVESVADITNPAVYGYAGGVAIFLVLWGMVRFFNNIRGFFGTLFAHEHKDEPFVRRHLRMRIVALLHMLIISTVVAFLITGTIAISLMLSNSVPLDIPLAGTLLHGANIAIGFLSVLLLFALSYRLLSASQLSWRSACKGAFGGTLLLTATNSLFAWYLTAGADWAVYGALGFFIAFMLWIYYALFAFLSGGVLANLCES